MGYTSTRGGTYLNTKKYVIIMLRCAVPRRVEVHVFHRCSAAAGRLFHLELKGLYTSRDFIVPSTEFSVF